METMASEGMALLLMIVSTTMSTIALSRHGTPEQKKRYLPGLAAGTTRISFAITEPNAGSNSYRMETLATRDGDGYRIRGQKYFISGVEQTQHCLLVTRTTAARDVSDKRAGLSLFVVDTDAPGFTKQVQDTALNETEHQWTLFLDDVRVSRACLIGEEGAGHRYLFDLLNPERVVSAAIAAGLGRYVLKRAVAYARDRKVFSVPIGAHQGLAHPMALAHAHLELASLMGRKAAWLFDEGKPGGAEANAIAWIRTRIRPGEIVYRNAASTYSFAQWGGLPQPWIQWTARAFGFSAAHPRRSSSRRLSDDLNRRAEKRRHHRDGQRALLNR